MKILINYADDKFKKAQRLNTWTGRHIAKFDKIYSFGPEDIDLNYREQHHDILNVARGNGLWLWKPYFIDKVLNMCNEGDYVFYIDSGCFFLRNADNIIDSFREDEKIWVSDIPLIESCFTKRECFKKMECDTDNIKYSNQIQSGYIVLVCCEETKRFIKEWQHYCEDFSLISSEGNNSLVLERNVGNGFVAHREDQSILSLLCKKKGIRPHREPSQRGFFTETYYNENYDYKVPCHDDDKYKSFVFLHKQRSRIAVGCCLVLIMNINAKVKLSGIRALWENNKG